MFSPRATHLHFALEYIAENLDCPVTVLQYPTEAELIRELKKGPDYVGVSFLIPVYHKMKELVALVRRHAPAAKIVLGGYGTVLDEDMVRPYGDYICREEGVAFFRKLLGQPPREMPYRHPMIVSKLRLFSLHVSRTGMIFAGLGCPNGCDFCCTSHFFKRRHIRLLPHGRDIYAVIERYLDLDPEMSFTILDEDFLLNKQRAMEFRECVLAAGRPLSIFAFASLKALSQYTMTELHEMGIDGCWIGYEGTRSGFTKQQGRPAAEVFKDLRDNGITVLASMIVGFDYQDPKVVAEELDGLLALEPCLSQFLIYSPTPGTPFWDRVQREGRLREDVAADRDKYCKVADGFASLVRHPKLSPAEIELLQARCFETDFQRLGPSVYRVIDRWMRGYRKLKDSPSPFLRAKAAAFARDVRKAYPSFLPGRLLGPNAAARARVAALEREVHAELGAPNAVERISSVAAVGAALWTGLCLKLGIFQDPVVTRTVYGPEAGATRNWWEELAARASAPGRKLRVDVQHPTRLVWLRIEGALGQGEPFWERVRDGLEQMRGRLVVDLQRLSGVEAGALQAMARALRRHRRRVRVVLPRLQYAHPELLLVAKLFQEYRP